MDIILTRFSETALATLSESELALYDLLLAENDHDLYQWVSGQLPTPAKYLALVTKIAEINRIAVAESFK